MPSIATLMNREDFKPLGPPIRKPEPPKHDPIKAFEQFKDKPGVVTTPKHQQIVICNSKVIAGHIFIYCNVSAKC